jgi:hypothetical protein
LSTYSLLQAVCTTGKRSLGPVKILSNNSQLDHHP